MEPAGGPVFGEIEEDAFAGVRAAIALRFGTARAEGYPIPEPVGRALARS